MNNKIAIVFHGGAGRSQKDIQGLPADCYYGLSSFDRHLKMRQQCDIYCHIWSNNSSENILNFLNPRASLITQPFHFNDLNFFRLIMLNRRRGLKPFLSYLKNISFNFNSECERIKAIYGRWMSASLALQLFETTIKKKQLDYDWVVLTRYDLELFTDFDFSVLDQSKIYFGKNVEICDNKGKKSPNRFYWNSDHSANLRVNIIPFRQGQRGLEDFFIIASTKKILILSQLFHDISNMIGNGAKINSHHLLEEFVMKNFGVGEIGFYKERINDFDLARRSKLGRVD